MSDLPEVTKNFLVEWSKPGSRITDCPVEDVRKNCEDNADLHGGEYVEVASIEDKSLPARGGGEFTVRVYKPRTETNKKLPAILFIHGGGWVIGSLKTVDKICRNLCKMADVVVVSVDYRLAPEYKFPTCLDDVEDAYIWLVDHAKSSELVCPHRLMVSGDSAGGNLAAALTVRFQNSGKVSAEYLPKYQLLVYPVTDLTFSGESYTTYGTGYGLDESGMTFFRDAYIGENLDKNIFDQITQNPEASPLFAEDFSIFPPTLLILAEADPLYDDSMEFAKKLEAAGIPVKTVVYPGMVHAFFNFDDIFEEAIKAKEELVAALKASGLVGCKCSM